MFEWIKNHKINLILTIIILLEFLFIINFKIVIGQGQSMLPTLNEFQILICDYENNFEVGEVVYYEIDGQEIVHRVINKENIEGVTFYTLQGDNNEYPDAFKVTNTNIKCKILWY